MAKKLILNLARSLIEILDSRSDSSGTIKDFLSGDVPAAFSNRFDELVAEISQIAVPVESPFAGLIYLNLLLGSGHLSGLQLEIVEKIDEAGTRRMAYIPPDRPSHLLLDGRLMNAFASAKLPLDRLNDAIDSFLIHEFLHFAQHMGFGRHSGLGRQSPWTLLAIDYQADALAAVTQTQLKILRENEADSDWDTYVDAIGAVIDQMEIFTRLFRRDLDRSFVARMPFSYEKLQRVSVWQLQYHRARAFNRALAPADLQVLAQPFLHFRSLEQQLVSHAEPITRNWPDREQAIFDSVRTVAEQDAPLIISATTRFGTTAFARCDLTSEFYAKLFSAFFSGDLGESGQVFDEIFQQHPWLVGKHGGNDDGWNGPGSPNGPTYPTEPLDAVSTPEVKTPLDRARAAFTPKTLPLTVFKAQPVFE